MDDVYVNVKELIELLEKKGIKYEITSNMCFYTITFGKYEVVYEPGDIFVDVCFDGESIDYDWNWDGDVSIPITLFKDVF